jgi:hypothetical protein
MKAFGDVSRQATNCCEQRARYDLREVLVIIKLLGGIEEKIIGRSGKSREISIFPYKGFKPLPLKLWVPIAPCQMLLYTHDWTSQMRVKWSFALGSSLSRTEPPKKERRPSASLFSYLEPTWNYLSKISNLTPHLVRRVNSCEPVGMRTEQPGDP